jgi:phosphopantothenoylcysteine decarboxylase / phosphopantothenate---cysteine ligase
VISGPVALSPPVGVRTIRVETAAEMGTALGGEFPQCDILVMAAAVADYKPAAASAGKRKKDGTEWMVQLQENKDLVQAVGKLKKPGQFICGFAAETDLLHENARAKLKKKNMDLIAANDVSREDVGFDSDRNELVLFWPDGREEALPPAAKRVCAEAVWDRIVESLHE